MTQFQTQRHQSMQIFSLRFNIEKKKLKSVHPTEKTRFVDIDIDIATLRKTESYAIKILNNLFIIKIKKR